MLNVASKKAIAEAQAKVLKKVDDTAAQVIRESERIAFSDIRKLYDDTGKLLPMSKWPEEMLGTVASVAATLVMLSDGPSAVVAPLPTDRQAMVAPNFLQPPGIADPIVPPPPPLQSPRLDFAIIWDLAEESGSFDFAVIWDVNQLSQGSADFAIVQNLDAGVRANRKDGIANGSTSGAPLESNPDGLSWFGSGEDWPRLWSSAPVSSDSIFFRPPTPER